MRKEAKKVVFLWLKHPLIVLTPVNDFISSMMGVWWPENSCSDPEHSSMTGAFNLQLSVGIPFPGECFLTCCAAGKHGQLWLILEFSVWNSAFYGILSDFLDSFYSLGITDLKSCWAEDRSNHRGKTSHTFMERRQICAPIFLSPLWTVKNRPIMVCLLVIILVGPHEKIFCFVLLGSRIKNWKKRG